MARNVSEDTEGTFFGCTTIAVVLGLFIALAIWGFNALADSVGTFGAALIFAAAFGAVSSAFAFAVGDPVPKARRGGRRKFPTRTFARQLGRGIGKLLHGDRRRRRF